MKNFIFDIDGTLLDTEAMYMKSLQAVLHDRGIEREYDVLAKTFGIPSRDALIRLKLPDVDGILAEWGPRTQAYRQTVAIYAGVEQALADLKAAGAGLAIMTSKQQYEYDRDVVSTGLDAYFSQAIVAEDIAHGKPEPDGILLAMKRLGAKPADTVYVGDTIYDAEASAAAHVTFGFAAWNGRTPTDFQADVSFITPAAMLDLL